MEKLYLSDWVHRFLCGIDLFVRQSHCTWPIAHDQFLL